MLCVWPSGWKSPLLPPQPLSQKSTNKAAQRPPDSPQSSRRRVLPTYIKAYQKYMIFWPQICIKISYKLLVLFNLGMFVHRFCLTKGRNNYEIIYNSLIKESYVLLMFFHFSKINHTEIFKKTIKKSWKNITYWTTRRPCQTLWCYTGCQMST